MVYKKTGQFQADKNNLKRLVLKYGYADFTFTAVDSGIENSTFIIKSDDTFVLRVYRYVKKSVDDINREVDFMQKLRINGLSVPRVLPNTSGKYMSNINIGQNQWSAIAMEYIAGHHPESYNATIIDQLAASQAVMHQIGIQYAQQTNANPVLQLTPGEFTDQIINEEIVNSHVKELIGHARAYTVILDNRLAYGYVHNDYDIENTLFDDNNKLVGILDFDDLVVMPVVVCLAFSLWSLLFETSDMKLVTRYINMYIKTRQLTTHELSYIPQILLFRHYAITTLLVLRGEIDDETLQTCQEVESLLLTMIERNDLDKYFN